jgi:hypothetical protein
MAKYQLNNGKIQFGTFLSKECWVIEGNLHSLEYILKTSGKTLPIAERGLLKLTISQMKKQLRRIKKEDKL